MQDHNLLQKCKHLLWGISQVTMFVTEYKDLRLSLWQNSVYYKDIFPLVRKGQTHYGHSDSNAFAITLSHYKNSIFLPPLFHPVLVLWLDNSYGKIHFKKQT